MGSRGGGEAELERWKISIILNCASVGDEVGSVREVYRLQGSVVCASGVPTSRRRESLVVPLYIAFTLYIALNILIYK